MDTDTVVVPPQHEFRDVMRSNLYNHGLYRRVLEIAQLHPEVFFSRDADSSMKKLKRRVDVRRFSALCTEAAQHLSSWVDVVPQTFFKRVPRAIAIETLERTEPTAAVWLYFILSEGRTPEAEAVLTKIQKLSLNDYMLWFKRRRMIGETAFCEEIDQRLRKVLHRQGWEIALVKAKLTTDGSERLFACGDTEERQLSVRPYRNSHELAKKGQLVAFKYGRPAKSELTLLC